MRSQCTFLAIVSHYVNPGAREARVRGVNWPP